MRSLRNALFLSILGGLFLVLCASGVVILSAARTSFRNQFDDNLEKRALAFGAFAIQERDEIEFDYHGPIREEELGFFVRMVSDNGAVMMQSPGWHPPPWNDDGSSAALGAATLQQFQIESGEVLRAVRIRLAATSDPETHARLTERSYRPRHIIIEIASRMDALDRAEASIVGAILAGAALAIGGTLLSVWLGIRWGLSPVNRLSAELDRMDVAAPKSLAGTAPFPNELRPIVSAVDRLLDRLQSAIERERRFIDAAAHELRTPIAELRTLTDVAGRWPDPERLSRSVGEARQIADEMDELLAVLLAAARGAEFHESAAAGITLLLPLVESELARAHEPLRQRGVHLEVLGSPEAGWRVSEGAARTIIRNLVENAVEYTPSGGMIRVSVGTSPSGACLSIENGPVNLKPGQELLLFEPFWRADQSRSDRNHRGLGLSVVASICNVIGIQRDVVMTQTGILQLRFSEYQSSMT